MDNTTETEKAESIKFLKSILKKNARVYTILRHVSQSGMSRQIDLYYFDKKGEKYYLSWHASKVLGWSMGKHGIKVSGCGMDMGFHLVYTLSRCMFGNKKNTGDSGYFLKQEWL